MSPPDLALATRRTALGLLAGTALAACDTGLTSSGPTSPTSPAPDSPTPIAGPDLLLAGEALTATATALEMVVATRARRPRLRAELLGLERLHRAHLTVLTDTAATGTAREQAPLSGGDARVRTEVRARERVLQAELARWAMAAEDGVLARLLAVLSAGVAQQLTGPAGEEAR